MADRTQASYAKIGFTIFIGALATVLTLIYIGGMGNSRDEVILETYYDKAVTGLAVGSPVNFRGVKVGRVSAISFMGCIYPKVMNTTDAGRIYIELAIDCQYLGEDLEENRQQTEDLFRKVIAKGARASVTSNGITGMSRVEIDLFPEDPPPIKISWTPNHIYIPPHLSLIDNFAVAATKAINNINRMDFNAVWTNVSRTVEALALASESARALMESQQGEVDKIVNNLAEASGDVREMARQLRGNPSLLIREVKAEPLQETAK